MNTAYAASNGDLEEAAAAPFSLDGLPLRNWGWFAVRGVLAIIVGIGAILLPDLALFTFALLFAAFSFADGLLAVISGIRGATRREERWWTLILYGLLGIGVGAVFFFFPLLGTVAYSVTAVALISAWAVVRGVFEIVAAYRLRREIKGEWLLMLLGGLSILLGILLAVLLVLAPAATMLSIAWVIGFYALLAGASLLVLSYRLRKHGTRTGAAENAGSG